MTLKEAREIAQKLTDRGVPKLATLNRWSSQEIIDNPEGSENWGKSGGRIGLYWEGLPVEIATICDLKTQYKLNKIAWAAELLRETTKDGYNIKASAVRDFLESGHVQQKYKEAEERLEETQKMLGKADLKNINKDVIERFENMIEQLEKLDLLQLYLELFIEKLEKYNKLPEVDLKKAANDS